MSQDHENLKPGDEAPPDAGAAAPNTCPACEGTGKTDGGETCEQCRGTGEVREAIGGG